MMSILALAKKRFPSPIFHLLRHRFFSSSSTQIQDPKSPRFKIDDYLISSFGFSPQKASAISKYVPHLKSPENPDAVRRLLRQQGFTEAHIKTLVSRFSRILCLSPQDTIQPNLRALRDIGLSSTALTEIVLSGPTALYLTSAVPRIIFWRDFLGGDEASLVKVFKCNRSLINLDIGAGIATKISLLQNYGISDSDIRRILCRVPYFINGSVSSMDDLLKRVKELGFQTDSGMFAVALHAIRSVSRELLKKKMELFKNFGWSEDEFLSAFQKAPNIVALSEENLQAKMDFLLGEAGCNLSYITFYPILLTYSLQKRLRPRHCVVQLLESKDLFKRKEFHSAINLSDIKFMAKYVLPHKEQIPELRDVFQATCASLN